ncbi:MAG: hypothetical protein RLN70_00860, partial [Rhodospirillaceae bacterium]
MSDFGFGITDSNKIVNHPTANMPRIGDVRTLVEDMGHWRQQPVAGTQLILVNFGGAVPEAK